ncbi:MAG: aldehyde ferredoxin oxidoreductase, partial [Nitrospirae bacterium]|nr:aldehyde ferredoxin oxidoreductase [Nitrospirota bacterium]
MADRTATFEDVPEKYKERAGRWLTSSIVASEVPATCHPLGPENKLVISAGLTSGTSSPSSARVSIGGKSPLTGTIKESNAGTGFAHMLARLRIKSIIIEGQPQDTTKYWTIKIDKNGPSFLPADQYVGLKLSEAYEKLFAEHGGLSHTSIMGIGVAGEYRLGAAGICFNDIKGRATRYSGRGGMGAVMGSKGL